MRLHNRTGAIETVELLGKRLYIEAFERGWDRAKKRSGDGPRRRALRGAIQITGIWHAREHPGAVVGSRHDGTSVDPKPGLGRLDIAMRELQTFRTPNRNGGMNFAF